MFLSVLVAASLGLPAGFVPPRGWIAKPLPADAPVNFIWLSPRFGINGNGDNLTLTIHVLSTKTSLAEEKRKAVNELSHEFTIVDSHAESTCRGSQDGWTFDARLRTASGAVVSQVNHLTILDGRLYAFIYTHPAGDPIDRAVVDSIESVCPNDDLAILAVPARTSR